MFRKLVSFTVFVVAISSAAPTVAAPIVFKDISYSQGGEQIAPFPGPLPTSLPFDFRISEPSPSIRLAFWREHYSPPDVGKSFFAPPEVIAAATAALSSTTAVWGVEVNGGPFNFSGGLWSLGFPPNHYITAIERIIDNLVITPVAPPRYNIQFAHRVRIWAAPIPEPTTMVLLGVAVGYFVMSRVGGRRR